MLSGRCRRRRAGRSREFRMSAASPRRSRPAAATAAGSGRGSLSSNGRPGTRQGVRTPHLRAANARRRVFPRRLLRRPRRVFRQLARQPCSARAAPRVARLRHDGVSPSRAVRRTTIHLPPRRFPRRCAFPRLAAFLAVGGITPIRALPRMWRTVPCDASTAYAAASQHGTGSSPPVGDAVTPGSSVPATSRLATN